MIAVVGLVGVLSGSAGWWVLRRWGPDPMAPRVEPGTVAAEVGRHTRLRAWLRDRTDPAGLTGFAGSSFPSGHATAAAATFAAYALIAGRGHTRAIRAVLGGAAVALTLMVASTRVLLGVHWLTDAMAGICLGWAWFGLCSIAFGGRLLHFGAPAETAVETAERVTQPVH